MAEQDQAVAYDHPSAMRTDFGIVAEFVARRVFGDVVMNERAVKKIRELSQSGTVVYVLRYRSLVDYFLVNVVLRREGLPLPVFANGVSASPFAPLRVLAQRAREKIVGWSLISKDLKRMQAHDYCARAVADGKPVLIFMRGRRSGSIFRRGMRRQRGSRVGSDYLREIVHGQWNSKGSDEKYIVPLALFRGHSFRRRETGLSAVVYSVQDVPSDSRKFVAYWWNRMDLFITVGKELGISDFMSRYHADSEERLVRRLSRAVQIFLQREERVVLGPALQPKRKIKAMVLENEEMAAGIRRLAEENHVSVSKLRKEADGYFEEMAANFNGILFGILAYFFKKIWNRMFTGLEPINFETVIEKVRHHPVVLVPCHRSHFDYLVITYLFHLNFVSPPHIFAGINMAFWPMGAFFRAAGAYFVRRTFSDNELYKLVFKQYLTFLIREGYTQEFFIEGGRSRTGKMLTPKLGMLSATINAYLGGVRRDLYLVPVAIHYGRIVEEESFQRELAGAEKQSESFLGLLRARQFLSQKYGNVYVSFGEPLSLDEALGENKQRFIEGAGVPEIEEEKRRFIQKIGFRILLGVNDATVAGATSISCTVLLGASHAGKRYEDFRQQANALAKLIAKQGIRETASLKRNVGDFRESLTFLGNSGLIEVLKRGNSEVLVVPDGRRQTLDFYKNNLIHAFLLPSLVTFGLLAGDRAEALVGKVEWWLNLFRFEFPLPEREQLPEMVEDLLEYYRSEGALEVDDAIRSDHPLCLATVGVLENFKEAYWIVARTIVEEVTTEGLQEKPLLEEIRRNYKTGLLLGELLRPEGASLVTFRNAINRYRELKFVATEERGRSGREKRYVRGADFPALAEVVDTLGKAIAQLRASR